MVVGIDSSLVRSYAWALRNAAVAQEVAGHQEVREAATQYAGYPADVVEREQRCQAVLNVLRRFKEGERVVPGLVATQEWFIVEMLLPPNSLRLFLLSQGGEFQIEEDDYHEWCFARGPVAVAGLMPLPPGFWEQKVNIMAPGSTTVGLAGVSAVSSPPAVGCMASTFARSSNAADTRPAGGQLSSSTSHSVGSQAEEATQMGAAGSSVDTQTVWGDPRKKKF
jgi:hypothetical protein